MTLKKSPCTASASPWACLGLPAHSSPSPAHSPAHSFIHLVHSLHPPYPLIKTSALSKPTTTTTTSHTHHLSSASIQRPLSLRCLTLPACLPCLQPPAHLLGAHRFKPTDRPQTAPASPRHPSPNNPHPTSTPTKHKPWRPGCSKEADPEALALLSSSSSC